MIHRVWSIHCSRPSPWTKGVWFGSKPLHMHGLVWWLSSLLDWVCLYRYRLVGVESLGQLRATVLLLVEEFPHFFMLFGFLQTLYYLQPLFFYSPLQIFLLLLFQQLSVTFSTTVSKPILLVLADYLTQSTSKHRLQEIGIC